MKMEEDKELETPGAPKSAMTSEEMIAMALTALAPALIGGAVGGKAGMYGGAAVGSKAAGGIAQNRVEEDKDAKKVAETVKAQDAASKRRVSEGVEIATQTAGLKPAPVTVTKNALGQVITVDEKTGTSTIVDPTKEPPKPEKSDGFKETEVGKAAISAGDKLTDDSRPYREALDAATEADELLKMAVTNPAAAAPGLRKMARASGEKGVLSDSDAKAFGGSQAIMDRFTRMAVAAEKGTLPKEDVDFAIAVTSRMKENSQKQYDTMQGSVVKRFAKNFGISEDDAYERITGSKRAAPPPPPEEPAQVKQARAWLKANPKSEDAEAVKQSIISMGFKVDG